MDKKNVYWGIFVIALATLTWEILLTRIFSATMYYHFVFMSISLAMLGFGCSGIIVYLFPEFFTKEKCAEHLTVCSCLFAATLLLAITIYLQNNISLKPSLASFVTLFKIFFFIFVPYFFSGLTITLALKHYSKHITILYCYDLTGAGLGCFVVIGLLFVYDGISLVLLTSFLAASASVIFSQKSSSKVLKTISLSLVVLLFIAFVCNAYLYRFLKIKYVQGELETGVIFEEWNPINRVTVVPGNMFDNNALIINYDSTATAIIHAFDGNEEKVRFLKDSVTSFYYQLRKGSDVLIIGVGGGQDVLNAYISGQKKITGVEINPTIARLNTETYRDFNGQLFAKPEITLVVDDGRNFVRHSQEEYDIIHLSNVDSGVASSSGAFTFVENSLYTVEAFKDYYRHLKDDGVMWIARWRFNNDLESFRILSGNLKALEEMKVERPEQHMVMIAEKYKPEWCQAIFLLKRNPFGPEEIMAIEELSRKMDLEWLHHPAKRLNTVFDDYLFSPDREAYLEKYPFRVDPNTDNCPFFFNFLKPIHYLWRLPVTPAHFAYPVFMFKALFVIVFIMVILTIFLPLMVFKKVLVSHTTSISFKGGYLCYFTCLGLGFMLVEVPLIQKFILFLGQPLYAISVILSSLLIFSGIGSLMAGGFQDHVVLNRLRMVLLSLCAFLIIYVFGLGNIFELFLGISGFVRVIISVLLICPLGILMGMAFPLGIRLLEQDGQAMIPWVWGVNGACSVLGSILAWGLSLNFGYNITILAAIIIYAASLGIMIIKPVLSEQS